MLGLRKILKGSEDNSNHKENDNSRADIHEIDKRN